MDNATREAFWIKELGFVPSSEMIQSFKALMGAHRRAATVCGGKLPGWIDRMAYSPSTYSNADEALRDYEARLLDNTAVASCITAITADRRPLSRWALWRRLSKNLWHKLKGGTQDGPNSA